MKVGVAYLAISMLKLLNEVQDWTSFEILVIKCYNKTTNKVVISLNQDCIHCYVVLSNVIAMYICILFIPRFILWSHVAFRNSKPMITK